MDIFHIRFVLWTQNDIRGYFRLFKCRFSPWCLVPWINNLFLVLWSILGINDCQSVCLVKFDGIFVMFLLWGGRVEWYRNKITPAATCAQGFCKVRPILCFCRSVLPILVRVTLLALGQSHYCHSTCDATLSNVDIIDIPHEWFIPGPPFNHIPRIVWDDIVYQLQRCDCWRLGMDKWFHPTLYNGYNYLSTLGFKLVKPF